MKTLYVKQIGTDDWAVGYYHKHKGGKRQPDHMKCTIKFLKSRNEAVAFAKDYAKTNKDYKF